MGSYTIGQVAERSGVPATALRYYEGIGLVPPAGRTDAGYRLYDDTTLARLVFIARAKQLGCTLEEIADLVEVWNGDRCGPVQRRLHDLVTWKLRDADAQVTELNVFAAQLRAAADQLAGEPIDGPCGDDSACLQAPDTDTARVIAGSPAARGPDRVHVGCRRGAGSPGRVAPDHGVRNAPAAADCRRAACASSSSPASTSASSPRWSWPSSRATRSSSSR